ncbi:sensor histidine kinase [Roseomonas marmotae]|uniref:histidine kinase n=1 Tax=Roseomonas marmotae TaxID=2768161 RepID=A0ABS3K856_9PROT|nr:sensor histidine kinase [Roseomonas marmotae]MBO1073100.1 sensor histidine kinase [Roseomonas marmotae]QTI79261.1 sensor histidine kinase [Roseomonas marmotae]
MLVLLMVASVPVIGIAGANAILGYEAELASGRRNAAMLGEITAERYGSRISTMREMLRGIARNPSLSALANDHCGADLGMLLNIYRDRYSNIWVLDGDGRLICSALPDAPRGGDFSSASSFALARDMAAQLSRRPDGAGEGFALDRFSSGLLTNRPILVGLVPVMEGTRLSRVIAAGLLMDAFIRSGTRTPLHESQRVWLADRENTLVPLTTARAEELPGEPLLRRLLNDPAVGAVEGHARNGQDFAYAISPLDADVRLVVGLPTGDIRRAANHLLLRRVGELAAFLLACLVVIVVGADIAIARPLRQLAWRVRAWRPGAPFGGRPLRGEPEEVRRLEQAFTDAAVTISAREEELRAALRQRDLLMAEIHHRVKNNLQIVASLLNLQAGRLRDPAARAEFGTARDRVQALATLHRHLYTNRSFEAIALRPFLEELCQQLFSALGETPGRRISLVVQAGELEIVTDQAVSLALLVTEAVTNSIKHAFPDDASGTITISVQTEPSGEPDEDGEGVEVLLSIRDNGQGMSEDDESSGGIGMTLIQGFAQHLGGQIHRHPGPAGGTELTLRFPLRRREGEISGRHMAGAMEEAESPG